MKFSGVLLDNAQELANSQRPEPTYEQLEQRFNLTVQDAVAHGLTSIHDAGFDPRSLTFFRRLASIELCQWRHLIDEISILMLACLQTR